jgi:hypothetical protein
MRPILRCVTAVLMICLAPALFAEPATPLAALASLPVKEVTVFKDGHAFVVHGGSMPTDAAGNVVLDDLPQPVLGTFWPYSSTKDAKLSAVTASVRKVKLEQTALSLRELIEANVGAQVMITETPVGAAQPITYVAMIDSIPTRTGEELESSSPPGTGEKLPAPGGVVLLRTGAGTKVVAFDRIIDVTFMKDPAKRIGHEEFRNLLTLKLDWGGKPPAKRADVGLMYLQRGVRWIPNYKVAIDGKGKAVVRLQATVINEMTDLSDVTANLVIGVPSFAFAGTPDPIALQQTAAQLSQYFIQPGAVGSNGNLDNASFAFSNSIMTQSARMGEVRQRRPGPAVPQDAGQADLIGDGESLGKNEDLFLFQVKHLSLKKGQRTVLPVAEWTVDYKDVYVLDVPIAPPPEVMRSFENAQQAEVARQLRAPRVEHRVRLTNSTDAPFTTAPALIVANDRVVAQGMMNYTAPGATFDLDLTAAVDVNVRKGDEETRRIPDAATWNREKFVRVDMSGKITLTNYSKQPLEIEVRRHVLGNVDSADHDGKQAMVNLLEDPSYTPTGRFDPYPSWYASYAWPYWWRRFNGVGRVTWSITIDPGKSVDLGYTWHYFWN